MSSIVAYCRLSRSTVVRCYSTSLEQAQHAIREHNSQINALVHVTTDNKISSTTDGHLRGWTVAIKSNLATSIAPTSCASHGLENFISPYTATAVTALERAGALMIGSANMDEFGMGSKTQYSIYGPTFNPYSSSKTNYSPGGSSGGSAAAVASGMCRIALGSDTGGSVRLPAAWCGIVGFKPSYGRISRFGLVSYGSSLDSIGILARSVNDIRLAYKAIAIPDSNDMTCMSASLRTRIDGLTRSRSWITRQETSSRKNRPLEGVRIGIPREFWVNELSDHALQIWKDGAQKLEQLGCEIVSVSLPHIPHTLPAYYTLALAEASSNLARYDGVRFGTRHKCPNTANLPNASLKYAQTRTRGLGAEVQRRILLGTYVMSAAAYQHYYLPSQRIRRLVQIEFNRVFALPNALYSSKLEVKERSTTVDALLFPTSTDTAPKQNTASDECPVSSYVNDVMTVPANLAGIPAISVPSGLCNGLPLGLQLAAQYGDDDLLLRIAHHIQTV
ncbi:Trimeric GatFAB AmidoTransferase(AdT) complex subunit [Coemansia brasiliensis]|uniref:Glutamyl-tRNA(Gln) amidotransferase subunit A, mitochondrial n=1 Tax=Coemansia brasiliensis TaxID=2650707 RepID=A0A9W8M283_9FUNG|nr:Trimeric GatFAB AmidoTransferase(AdT) complex subunit [Coemansia brasiliensis]